MCSFWIFSKFSIFRIVRKFDEFWITLEFLLRSSVFSWIEIWLGSDRQCHDRIVKIASWRLRSFYWKLFKPNFVCSNNLFSLIKWIYNVESNLMWKLNSLTFYHINMVQSSQNRPRLPIMVAIASPCMWTSILTNCIKIKDWINYHLVRWRV